MRAARTERCRASLPTLAQRLVPRHPVVSVISGGPLVRAAYILLGRAEIDQLRAVERDAFVALRAGDDGLHLAHESQLNLVQTPQVCPRDGEQVVAALARRSSAQPLHRELGPTQLDAAGAIRIGAGVDH